MQDSPFLQEAINVAATDWGLRCLRYEISEPAALILFDILC
jgi:hypothetical protein